MPEAAVDTTDRRQKLMDRLTAARQQGLSWETIHQSLNNRVTMARDQGVSEAAIQQSLGFTSPEELIAATQTSAEQNLAATKPVSWLEAFSHGMTHSSSAALFNVAPDQRPVEGRGKQLLSEFGEMLGDVPQMITGAVTGGMVGGAVGGAAGAAVPIAGETGASEVIGAAAGATIGASAGAMALPTLIKSQRDRYIQALATGQVKGPEDYLRIQAQVLGDTVEGANVGVITGGAGRMAAPLLEKMGANKITKFLGTAAAETGAMVTAQAAMANRMPRMEDFVDAAVMIGAFHTATKLTPSNARAVRTRVMQYYTKTGELPGDAAERAMRDPVFRAQMLGLPDPVVPAGSSHTQTGSRRAQALGSTALTPIRPGTMTNEHTPLPGDVFIIPRVAGDFDHAVGWVFKEEGGMNTDTGGLTKYGISAKAHPGLDIANLSREEAQEIYHKEYWRAIDADALPPNMRLAAFDSAVNQGVGQTKTWLREAGGDLQKFMQLRVEKYAKLVRDPSGKWAKYADGWANRLKHLGASDAMANIVRNGPNNVGREFTPEDVMALGAGGAGTPLTPTPTPAIPSVGPSADPWATVASRVANDVDGDIWGDTVHGALRIYGELFDPTHPIRSLVDAITKGNPLDDYQNPEMLFRVAENSGEVAKIAVKRNMVDLDGNVTGPGLEDIVSGKSVGVKFSRKDQERFLNSYAVAKWALMMNALGKESGVPFADARAVVAEAEAGGLVIPGENVPSHLARILVGLEYVDQKSKKLRGSPHYNPRTKKIVMPTMTDAEYRAKYGPNLGHDEVLAHETGHAIADNLSKDLLRGDWSALTAEDLLLLHDELTVASRRFRPEFWLKSSGQTGHVAKPQELVADSIATWLTDPVARTRMPEFKRIIEGALPGFNLEATLGAIPKKYGTPMQQAFDQLIDWRNGTARWLRDGGINDSEKYRMWVADHDAAIPGYRRMDDGSPSYVSTGKPGIWNPIKTAKGSERQIEPVLKSLMQDAFIRHQLAANNRAMMALANLGIVGGKISEKRAVDINLVAAFDELKKQGISDDLISSLVRSAGAAIPKDQLPVFRDGKLYGLEFDPEYADVVRVLRGYDDIGRNAIVNVVAKATSFPRNMQTRYNPLFPIRNLFYDTAQQIVTNPDAINPALGFFSGLGHMTAKPDLYAKWLQSGGAEHIFTAVSKDAWMKRVIQGHEEQSLAAGMWNVMRAGTTDALTAWTRMMSQPARFDRYVKGIERGETPLRAAVASSDVATPRGGYGGPVGQLWNIFAPYTTAYLNGLEKSVRSQFSIGRTVTGTKYDWKRTTVKGLVFITAPVIAQWFAYKDEKWYKAMPPWQKDNAWFIIPPIGDVPAIPIMAPPLISMLYAALPRRLLEGFVADNPHAAEGIWDILGTGLMPPNWVTGASILTPFVEHMANYSFNRDRPLVAPNMVDGVQPAEQFTQYSSQAAKNVAQFMSDLPLVHSNWGWSPQIIDNYISQLSGPGGRAMVNAAAAASSGTPHNAPPEQRVADWPGISSWTVRYPNANAAPIQQFYDMVTKLDQEHGSLLKTIRNSDFARFKRIVDEGGPSAAAYHQLNLGQNVPPNVDISPYLEYIDRVASRADQENLSLVHQAVDALKNARDYSYQVYENPQLTAHDKRQMLDMTNAVMQAMAERGNEAADRAHIGVSHAGASGRAAVPESIQFVAPE